MWIHKDGIYRDIPAERVQEYLDKGFVPVPSLAPKKEKATK